MHQSEPREAFFNGRLLGVTDCMISQHSLRGLKRRESLKVESRRNTDGIREPYCRAKQRKCSSRPSPKYFSFSSPVLLYIRTVSNDCLVGKLQTTQSIVQVFFVQEAFWYSSDNLSSLLLHRVGVSKGKIRKAHNVWHGRKNSLPFGVVVQVRH